MSRKDGRPRVTPDLSHELAAPDYWGDQRDADARYALDLTKEHPDDER